MKSLLYLIPVLCLAMACGDTGGAGAASANASLNNFEDSLSYAFGSLTADDLKTRGVTLKADVFKTAIDEEIKGSASMSEEAMFKTFSEFSKELQTAGGSFTEATPTTVNMDSLSYAIGKNLGGQLKGGDVNVNVAAAANGLTDVYGGTLKIDKVAAEGIMQKYTMEARKKQMEANAAAVQPNIEAGKAFLAENGKKKGIITTDTGLQYEILTKGSGAKPAATDKVKVNYEGKFLDGEIFDSSYERGKPIEFSLNQVIRGWTEGVQLMSPGAKFRFFVPQELAYGPQGKMPDIPGGSTLIFVVELLEVK
ncbi:MAG: FKBP-type peptidyl-prolyl cis-trans isomerase N-terminal domain-containing protein [Saprospiraceae bacterium]